MQSVKRKQMNNIIRTLLLIAFATSLQVQAQTYGNTLTASLLHAGVTAPDFKVTRLGGGTLQLKELQQQPFYIVLTFWASWCPDCRKDTPRLKALVDKYNGYGVSFAGISLDTDSSALKTYLQKNKMMWPQGSEFKKWKHGSTIDKLYGVNWIPTSYVIGPDQTIVLATCDVKQLAVALDSLVSKGKIQKTQLPEFNGDVAKYLAKNLNYPVLSQEAGISGTVVVSFELKYDGSIDSIGTLDNKCIYKSSAKTKKKSSSEIEAAKQALQNEAIRVVKEMPAWEPLRINGRPSNIFFMLPVTFKL